MNKNKFFNIPMFKNSYIQDATLELDKLNNKINNNNLFSSGNTENILNFSEDTKLNQLKDSINEGESSLFKSKSINKLVQSTINNVEELNSSESLKFIEAYKNTFDKLKPKNSNLVFLQNKGSVKANPCIIGYKFSKGNITGVSSPSTNINYNNLYISENNEINNLFIRFFKGMYCLISKPIFMFTSDAVKIQLFYFISIPKNLDNNNNESFLNLSKDNLIKVYYNRFVILTNILSRIFNKTVKLELIRVHQPYFDSNILTRFTALFINKRNISVWIKRLFNLNIGNKKTYNSDNDFKLGFLKNNKHSLNSILDGDEDLAKLSGIRFKISGRLMKEPIIPRITTKKFEKGFTARGRVKYLDIARLTHKNRKGAFTITIKSGQNF